MVKVCDEIMGSGKTSATITYINAHPEKRFLYITPYLQEAARIKECCPEANFAEPSEKLPQYGFSKANHMIALISEGRNIASTHQAALYYTEDTIESLRKQNYTLIIDEEVNILQHDKWISYSDVKLAEEAGYIRQKNNEEYVLTDKAKDYHSGRLSHIFRIMESRPLICIQKNEKSHIHYWMFSKSLLESLEEVYILTYLFPDSEIEMFLNIHSIPYVYVGVRKNEDGKYEFSDERGPQSAYMSRLDEMIHIESSEKMNRIGDKKTALSMSWYQTCSDADLEQLRKNIYNFFRNRAPGSVEDRMCGTYKNCWGKIRSKGYWNSNVSFSQKASNDFRNRSVLAYPVNLFANVHVVNFYRDRGQQFDNDRYALSIMVQWIWRSAIRNGREIMLYVPSRRMRNLLTDWMKEVGSKAEQDCVFKQ